MSPRRKPGEATVVRRWALCLCMARLEGVQAPHRQEGVDNVRFDAAEWFVLEHEEYLFFFVQGDEVPKPGAFGQSEREGRRGGQEGPG